MRSSKLVGIFWNFLICIGIHRYISENLYGSGLAMSFWLLIVSGSRKYETVEGRNAHLDVGQSEECGQCLRSRVLVGNGEDARGQL